MNHITNKDRQTLLKNGEKIFLYKKGSRGEILGVYDSVNDIVHPEMFHNGMFQDSNIYVALNRGTCFYSYHFGCMVKPVIKKQTS